MRIQRGRLIGALTALGLLIAVGAAGTGFAESASSSHYQVNEVQFGSGASIGSCSNSYCANQSLGSTVVGNASSNNYRVQFGPFTTNVPLLEVIVDGSTQDLGTFGVDSTATATSEVKVRSYLSNGYELQVAGSPPSEGAHTLAALTTPTTSHAGAEQFGINLRANTAPAVGADPVQVPSSQFSFGTVTENYDTPNLFMYQDGDQIASSATSTGETDYTISMIFNISNATPAGHYTGSITAVAVANY